MLKLSGWCNNNRHWSWQNRRVLQKILKDPPNHSTGDESPTGDIISQIDLEEEADCQTGLKLSESLAKIIELKWQTKLILD